MIRPLQKAAALLRVFWRGRSGVSAAVTALLLVPVVGSVGLAVDIGHVLAARQSLQASTDAAALAGAQDIATGTDPAATVAAYGARGHNKVLDLTVTLAAGYPQLRCFKSTGAPCVGPTPANGIVVRQQTAVQTYFTRLFGLSSIPIAATATAGAAGGKPMPLNVMLVLDTTASMNNRDYNCSLNNATRLGCALAGVRTLLGELSPSVDQVGLMVFPGLQANQAKYDYDCSSGTSPRVVAYNKNPVYQVVAASSDFRASDDAKGLNTSSDLALAAGGGDGSCRGGISAVGGVSTFYADAISQAQSALVATAKPGMQNVIVFLSDGDANASKNNMPPGRATNECHQAIAAAKEAAAASTWVYSIAYGASVSAGDSCSTDKPSISACSTMQQIASDPAKFFSDNTGGSNACSAAANDIADLVSIFQKIAQTLQKPRLLADNTT
jgi:hypothetical protein